MHCKIIPVDFLKFLRNIIKLFPLLYTIEVYRSFGIFHRNIMRMAKNEKIPKEKKEFLRTNNH